MKSSRGLWPATERKPLLNPHGLADNGSMLQAYRGIFFLGVAFLFSVSTASSEEGEEKPKIKMCTSTREYVTTLEFLRSRDEFALKEIDAQAVADEVSKGCTGAAKRFIQVVNLLTKSRMGSREATVHAKKLALLDDEKTETFITVFRSAFLQKYLDLDLISSLKIALFLASEFKGDQPKVREDFEALVEFCLKKEGLNFPKPRCASLAARVAGKGATFEEGVASDFEAVFEFVRSTEGPEKQTNEAAQIAEEVVTQGPGAMENFQQAFQFAISGSGLSLDKTNALAFARKMASRSIEPTEKPPKLQK